ncbi:MAG: hypothetical protein A3B25_00940 [Candidatus Ryanbacteria bacterium RIFCSPLOWO2_01_FULL_48_26]|uniref:Uncharacterized protein n=1 Tax=Candidatus Ryanbacteria bacterium RIFCSPLOWO2_01_FULL_48_26 TaxID=1802126 RepID=A0A1G2GRB7_9BACT|nr:MAG: hypothetical protein A3B25_00940 [Candidatus Ryanbacteria bacterium RIFCSPLOWO2_01_FULL_48_26]
MKSIILAVGLLATIWLVLCVYFYGNLSDQILNSFFSQQKASTSSTNIPPNTANQQTGIPTHSGTGNPTSSSTGKIIPGEGFKGPTGQPSIRGPSGPPPNY